MYLVLLLQNTDREISTELENYKKAVHFLKETKTKNLEYVESTSEEISTWIEELRDEIDDRFINMLVSGKDGSGELE